MPDPAAAVRGPAPDEVNELLRRCPPDVARRWAPVMHRVTLAAGTELYAADSPIAHVYFPLTAVVAVDHWRSGGQAQAVALLGRDDLAGASVLLGPDSGPQRATVMVGGTALRLKSGALLSEVRRVGAHDTGDRFRVRRRFSPCGPQPGPWTVTSALELDAPGHRGWGRLVAWPRFRLWVVVTVL